MYIMLCMYTIPLVTDMLHNQAWYYPAEGCLLFAAGWSNWSDRLYTRIVQYRYILYMYKFLRHVNFEDATDPTFLWFYLWDHQGTNPYTLATTSNAQSQSLHLMYQNCPRIHTYIIIYSLAWQDHASHQCIWIWFSEKCS